MRRSLAQAILALLLLSSGVMLSACNTVRGAGEDVSDTGRAIQRAVP